MSGNDFKFGIEKKEKKLSWSIVFAWLYLHTFGKILPKKWNKWAENIVEPYEVTNSDEARQPEDDKVVDSAPQLQINRERKPDEVTNTKQPEDDEDTNIRQPGDGQSASSDSESQTENKAEGINNDDVITSGDEIDDVDELWYDDEGYLNAGACFGRIQLLLETKSDQDADVELSETESNQGADIELSETEPNQDADIELSQMGSDQDAALLAQIKISQARFNNRYLQIIEEQAKDIEQLESKAAKDLQIIANLLEKIEQLKRELQNRLPSKPIDDGTFLEDTQMSTTKGTHQITEEPISTSMVNITKIGNSLGRCG